MVNQTEPTSHRLRSLDEDLREDHAAIVEDLMGLSQQIDRIQHTIEITEEKMLARQSYIDDLNARFSRLEHNVGIFTEKIDKMKHDLLVILILIILGSEGAGVALKSWLGTNLAPTAQVATTTAATPTTPTTTP